MAPPAWLAGRGGRALLLQCFTVASAWLRPHRLIAAVPHPLLLASPALPAGQANDELRACCEACVCACDCVFVCTAVLSARNPLRHATFSASSPLCCCRGAIGWSLLLEPDAHSEVPCDTGVWTSPRTLPAELYRESVVVTPGFILSVPALSLLFSAAIKCGRICLLLIWL